MTEQPMGEPFHSYEVEPAAPLRPAFHSYVAIKDANQGVKYAARLAMDRARQAGNNVRDGILTIYFDDRGVGAKWEPKENA